MLLVSVDWLVGVTPGCLPINLSVSLFLENYKVFIYTKLVFELV